MKKDTQQKELYILHFSLILEKRKGAGRDAGSSTMGLSIRVTDCEGGVERGGGGDEVDRSLI